MLLAVQLIGVIAMDYGEPKFLSSHKHEKKDGIERHPNSRKWHIAIHIFMPKAHFDTMGWESHCEK